MLILYKIKTWFNKKWLGPEEKEEMEETEENLDDVGNKILKLFDII